MNGNSVTNERLMDILDSFPAGLFVKCCKIVYKDGTVVEINNSKPTIDIDDSNGNSTTEVL